MTLEELQILQVRISILKDVFTIVTTLVAAGVALWGIHAWREQLKGKTEFELAQKLLRAVYKVRNAFGEVRSPVIFAGEISQAVKEEDIDIDPNLDNEKKQNIGVGATYRMRWKKVLEAFVELDALVLEAEAIWGQKAPDNIRPLKNCANTLATTIAITLDRREHPHYYPEEAAERDRKIMSFTSSEKDNFFSKEIDDAVRQAEYFLKPHLKI